MAFIYVITNDVNGKQYVGKTNFSIEKRFKEHLRDRNKRQCEKRPLYNAMNKYGIEHFHIEELEECSAEESSEREEYWISKLNTCSHNGYNATYGGDGSHYRNYKEIADKYLELQNQKDTAKYCNCDVGTVRIACQTYNIPIKTSQELMRKTYGKSIIMLPDNIVFRSLNEAAEYLRENNYTQAKSLRGIAAHIRNAAKNRNISYTKYWQFIN